VDQDEILRLNTEADEKQNLISVTDLVSKLETSPLKLLAERNVDLISVTRRVSHPVRSDVKAVAEEKVDCRVFTLLVFCWLFSKSGLQKQEKASK